MKTEETAPAFIAYAVGLVHASVCSALPVEETAARLNAEHPTGVGPWTLSDEDFRDGTPNGCTCHDHPETHQHWLFVC